MFVGGGDVESIRIRFGMLSQRDEIIEYELSVPVLVSTALGYKLELLTPKRFLVETDQNGGFLSQSLRGLDQGIPSDPLQHGRFLESDKSQSRGPLDDPSKLREKI
jgi:hypothetical protein